MTPRPPQRDVLDKLGIVSGKHVVIDERAWTLGHDLKSRIVATTGHSGEGAIDIVIASVSDLDQVHRVLHHWRPRIQPAGAIWVLTHKRVLPDYVDQRLLIPVGLDAALVDNKTCSVSDTISGMRFVIRLRDRPT